MHPTPGCLPCKSRKKKCDTVKPICTGCTRNYLVCVWPTEAQGRPRSTRGIPASALSMFSATPPTPVHKADADQDKPDSSRRRRGRRSSGALPLVLGPLSLTGPLSPESKYLLDHYLHSTGKKASAHVGSYTPFTDALMPIADASGMLFETILTFSCFHLAANGAVVSPVNTLEQHGVALKSLKYGITRYSHGDKDFGIPLFLSMLMLTCTEIANGGQSRSAFQHLSALRRLAPDVLGRVNEAPTSYKRAIIFGRELYAYCLAIACISDSAATDDSDIIEEASEVFSEISASEFTGALFGCSYALYCLIPQTVSLLNKARILGSPHNASPVLPTDESGGSSLRSQIAILLTTISLWEPPTETDVTFQHSGRILQLGLTAMMVEATHWANLSCQAPDVDATTMRFWPLSSISLDTQLKAIVNEGVSLLRKLPPVESQIATTMCWSIVVLGSYATIADHRTTIREYLLTMEAIFGFDNMKRTRLTLEYIWAHVKNFEEDRPVAIADAMRATGGMFILG